MHGKLKQTRSRAGLLAADKRPPAEKVKELFLWVYARPPTLEEGKAATDFLTQEAAARRSGPKQQTQQWPYEDLLWALLNTKEFLFNH